MASFKSFEDLEVWQRARKFAHEIFELTLDGSFARDFSLRDQINKSAGSIMDNISEGFERGGNKEFILFLSYSKGSAGETRSQLYRALDRNHLSKDTFDRLKSEALHISKMIGRLMQYLQHSNFKGSKFHEPETLYGNPNASYSIDDED